MSGEEVKRILTGNGISLKVLAERLGTTPQNVSNLLSKEDIRTGLLEDISRVTGITLDSFLIGPRGAITFSKETSTNTVPLLPIFAQAGSLTGWSEGVEESKCERVISPVNDVDMAVHIYGESMYPDIQNGSVVYVRRINPRAFIEWGRAYILDTVNGPLLKYLTPGSDDEHIRCVSANHDPMYAPFEVAKEDVLGIYRVVMCMSMK